MHRTHLHSAAWAYIAPCSLFCAKPYAEGQTLRNTPVIYHIAPWGQVMQTRPKQNGFASALAAANSLTKLSSEEGVEDIINPRLKIGWEFRDAMTSHRRRAPFGPCKRTIAASISKIPAALSTATTGWADQGRLCETEGHRCLRAPGAAPRQRARAGLSLSGLLFGGCDAAHFVPFGVSCVVSHNLRVPRTRCNRCHRKCMCASAPCRKNSAWHQGDHDKLI